MPASKSPAVEIEVDNRVVRVSNPDRVYFPESGATKLDLVEYYLAVGPGIVNALFERPCMLHRFPKGLAGDKVHQKRIPPGAPPWVETVQLHFPRWNRTADELCVTELGSVIWAVQMSTVEFHPWNSRRDDTEKPDEWRIDLDPGPTATTRPYGGSRTSSTRSSTSSARPASPRPAAAPGMHVYVRIPPDHGFKDVRRAALAFAREVERRAPEDVTTAWWRKDRDPQHLFVDYNQNARDHTIAAAYSVRGVPDARVSTPIRWDEVDDADPRDFTISTVPGPVRRARRPARRHRRARVRHRPVAGVGRPRRAGWRVATGRSGRLTRHDRCRAGVQPRTVRLSQASISGVSMDTGPELKKTLTQRQLSMIAMGGVIGAGLFVGSGAVIADAGPGAFLTYAMTGVLIIMVMRMLAEMAVANPSTGSFADYARDALGVGPGSLSPGSTGTSGSSSSASRRWPGPRSSSTGSTYPCGSLRWS